MVQRITIQPHQLEGSRLTLHPEQIHYLHRVLRLSSGSRFIAQDGAGSQWLAVLDASPATATITETLTQQTLPLDQPLQLIAALPKGNSFDQVVRQATELGVTHISPVISDRTLIKPSQHKLARWQRIATEASEQCERGTIPIIAPPTQFAERLQQIAQEPSSQTVPLNYICVAREENSPHLLQKIQNDLMSEGTRGVNLMVGPEGGWTTREITVATEYGYEVVSLGSVILRAVTASITALSLIVSSRELLI